METHQYIGQTHPYLVFTGIMLVVSAIPISWWWLFRRARRETCTWPRWVRRVAQGPGWFLVITGAYLMIMKASDEIRAKHVGLGTGTVVACIGAVGKALLRPAEHDEPA